MTSGGTRTIRFNGKPYVTTNSKSERKLTPGSKSVSNRALLLAALSTGTTRLTNLLDSDDIRHMLNALTQLGVDYQLSADKTVCEVTGVGGAFSSDKSPWAFLGNAGTAMRPLAAALCLGRGEYVLTGEPRMKRPIGHSDCTESWRRR